MEKKMKKIDQKKIEAQKARRRDYYSQLWDVQLDPKKMHNQDLKNNMRKWIRQADEERYKSLKSLKPKKPIPKVDLPSISKGISNYMELTKKEEETKRPENFGKKFRDPDMEKGIGSLDPNDKMWGMKRRKKKGN